MSLRNKIVLILLFFSVIPVVVIGLIETRRDQQVLTQQIGADSLEFAQLVLQRINEYLYSEFQHVRGWAETTGRLGSANQDQQAHISRILTRDRQAYDEYYYIVVSNRVGQVVAASEPQLIGHDRSAEPDFRTAVEGKESVEDVAFDAVADGYAIIISFPVTDAVEHSETVGVISAALKWDKINQMITTLEIGGRKQTKSDHLMLFNSEGLVISCFDPNAMFKTNLIETRMKSARYATEKKDGFILDELTEHNVPSFSAYTYLRQYKDLPDLGWSLLVYHDPQRVFATVHSLKRTMTYTLLISVMILAFVSFVFADKITRPILAIASAARAVGSGDLSNRVKINSKDEVGTLAASFNNMVEDLQRFHNAVRQSETKYKTLTQSIPGMVYIGHPDWSANVVSNSEAVCGYCVEDFDSGRVNWLEIIHPDDKQRVTKEARELDRGPVAIIQEYRIIDKGGNVRWVEDHKTSEFTDQGLYVGMDGIVFDITERKRIEQALKESEMRYRALFEAAAEGMIVADIETKEFKYVNPSICRMLGYAQDELKKLSVYDIHPKESLEHVISEFRAQSRGEKTLATDLSCLRKDGSIVYADIHATRVLIDGRDCNVGFFTDITDRKEAQLALQQAHAELELRVKQRTADIEVANKALGKAEERFRTIFENSVVGIYRTTPDGRTLMANPAAVEMLGYSSFNELARTDLEKEGFSPPHLRAVFRQRLEEKGKLIGVESTWRKRDGTKLFVRESAVVVRDDDGNVLYYEGTAEDVTKRKEAEEQLVSYQNQLRSLASELVYAEERLRRRIATEIHDGIGQNLAMSKIKLESLKESVSSAEAGASLKEISQLIAQTIASSRSLTFELSPPVLYELGFEPAMEWLTRQMREQHGLSAEYESDNLPKPMTHDLSVLLFQAVRELLVNVAKHAEAHKVVVSTRRVNDRIEVGVADDGVGFETSGVVSYGGDTGGFGLFSIRERLGHIGGRLDITSSPGRGTRVTLVAPIEQERNDSSKEKPE